MTAVTVSPLVALLPKFDSVLDTLHDALETVSIEIDAVEECYADIPADDKYSDVRHSLKVKLNELRRTYVSLEDAIHEVVRASKLISSNKF